MERTNRMMLGVLGLIAVWVVVYWRWPPPGAPREPLESERSEDVSREATEGGGALPPLVIDQTPGPEVPAGAIGETTPAPPEGFALAPGQRAYRVRAGDAFGRIAARELGSARRGAEVAAANPLKDPRRLRPGEWIRIPGATQGPPAEAGQEPAGEPATGTPDGAVEAGSDDRPLGTGSASVGPRPEDAAGPGEGERPRAAITYTVRRGDTLSAIASRFYGSVRHAEALYRANRGVLASPDALAIGDEISLPPRLDGTDRLGNEP